MLRLTAGAGGSGKRKLNVVVAPEGTSSHAGDKPKPQAHCNKSSFKKGSYEYRSPEDSEDQFMSLPTLHFPSPEHLGSEGAMGHRSGGTVTHGKAMEDQQASIPLSSMASEGHPATSSSIHEEVRNLLREIVDALSSTGYFAVLTC